MWILFLDLLAWLYKSNWMRHQWLKHLLPSMIIHHPIWPSILNSKTSSSSPGLSSLPLLSARLRWVLPHEVLRSYGLVMQLSCVIRNDYIFHTSSNMHSHHLCCRNVENAEQWYMPVSQCSWKWVDLTSDLQERYPQWYAWEPSLWLQYFELFSYSTAMLHKVRTICFIETIGALVLFSRLV